jgi:hypothetical protein
MSRRILGVVIGAAAIAVLFTGVHGQGQREAGTWQPAGSLSVIREGASSVLLPDGRVLVLGGRNEEGPVASAEIYAEGVWSPVNGLGQSWGQTATVLADGRVLIVGGRNANGVSRLLDIYDPLDDTVTPAGALATPRTGHAATLLQDGRVLIAGGFDGQNVLDTIELVDPGNGVGTVAPLSLTVARAGLSATTLVDGRVLLAGGNDGNNDVALAEVVDVSAAVVSVGAMGQARRDHQAVRLPFNNNVLLVGGASNGTIAGAELFRSWTGEFIAAAAPAAPRVSAAGSALAEEGWALIAGGQGEATAERYAFATVTTDKDDYVPGDVVYVSGTGWQPGEDIAVSLREVPSEHQPRTFTLTADGSGSLVNAVLFTVEDHHLGVRFFLTARGAASQAHITFTDGNVNVKTVGATAAATVNWERYGTTACSGSLPELGVILAATGGNGSPIPAGATDQQSLRLTAAAVVNGQPFANWSWSENGTTFVETANPVCVPGRTSTRHIQANYGGQQATVLSVAAASGTYGGTADLSATLTAGGVGVSGKTISFSLNGVPAGTATTNAAGVATGTGVSLAGIAAGTYAAGPASGVAASFTSDATHTGSSGGNSLAVAKADQVIAWSDPTAITYGTALGSSQLNAALTVGDGTLLYTPGTGTVLAAGTHTLQVAAAETTNYKPATKTVSLLVEKADQVLEWAAPGSIVYGTALGGAQLNASVTTGDGALTYTPAAGTVLNAGSHTLRVDAAETANYKSASKTVDLTVEKANQVLEWATPATIVYGTALSGAQLNASVTTGDGTLTYTPAAGTVLNAGSHTLQVDAAETANYKPASKTVTLVVEKADQVIAWSAPANIVYGTPLGAAQLNASRTSGDGELTYTPAAGTVLNAGSHTLRVDAAETANYNPASQTVSLLVERKPATITLNDRTKIYGDTVTFAGTEFTTSGFIGGDQVTSISIASAGAPATSAVGQFDITGGSPTGDGLSNYVIDYEKGVLSVSPRPLMVTANDTSKILGAADPALTYHISGGSLVNSDQVGGTLVRLAGESIGAYPIEQGTVSAGSNYALSFVPGTFRIEYAPATVPCLGGYGKTILQPINANGLSVFKQGATVPAKFRVCDASGNSVGTPGVVTAFRLLQITSGTVTVVNEEVLSTTADSAFRWSADGAQWIFNISTKNLQGSQTYVYQVSLNDGTSFTFAFGLK